jgi:hypothetical protein
VFGILSRCLREPRAAHEACAFRRKVVHIRRNKWRDFKHGVERTVSLWPQDETELREYLGKVQRIVRGLLFPGFHRTGAERKLWGKLYKQLTRAAAIAQVAKHVTLQVLRVSYCAAPLEGLDNGQPVGTLSLQRAIGHSSPGHYPARIGTARSF